jgi:hypothetical protein
VSESSIHLQSLQSGRGYWSELFAAPTWSVKSAQPASPCFSMDRTRCFSVLLILKKRKEKMTDFWDGSAPRDVEMVIDVAGSADLCKGCARLLQRNGALRVWPENQHQLPSRVEWLGQNPVFGVEVVVRVLHSNESNND